jgi:probable sporulation protein (polysaccharide deacetylase family)
MNEMWKKGFVIVAFFTFVYLTVNESGSITRYIAAMNLGSVSPAAPYQTVLNEEGHIDPASLTPEQRVLYEQIVKKAEELRIAPIQAKVDPVWKAIPALNGLEVDIDRTYAIAVEQKDPKTIPFVFREVPAEVTLDDLGAQPIYKGNPRKPMVSLMINVAWKEENIPGMLQTLKDENVKATFFFLGSWLKEHPEVAKQIAEEGHELSNHAYSHDPMSQMSDVKAKDEIVKTQQMLKETLGVENKLFAPPSGNFDADTVRVAHGLGLRTVLWTLDTIDWKEPPSDAIVRKVAARLEPGSLILMHPTVSASGALKGIIQEAKRRGLAIGTVSETLSPNRVPTAETPAGF